MIFTINTKMMWMKVFSKLSNKDVQFQNNAKVDLCLCWEIVMKVSRIKEKNQETRTSA